MNAIVPTLFAGVAGVICGGLCMKRVWKKKHAEVLLHSAGQQKQQEAYYHWLLIRQKGGNLEQYFVQNQLQNLAVYAMESLGRRFCDELRGSETVRLRYAIEQDNPSAVHETLEVLRLRDDPLPAVDAVVICALEGTEAIEQDLRAVYGEHCKTITIEEAIAGMISLMELHPRDGVLKDTIFDPT